MSKKTSDFEQRLDLIIGQRAFALTRDLVTLGLFGTAHGAREALQRGDLPGVKFSERRWAVPRDKLIEFVRQRIKESTHD